MSARSQTGFAFVYVLMGIAVVSTVFYVLSSLITMHTRQSSMELNTAQARMILHSLVDYSVEAIKQNLCLSESMLPERPCNLNHPRAVGRLLMNSDSERILKSLGTLGSMVVPNPVRLNEITTTINLGEIRDEHPLSAILSPLSQLRDVRQISFILRRDYRPKLATTGREVFLNLIIELRDGGGIVTNWLNTPLRATADLAVFPRELGTFGLVVANDLRMDGPFSPAARGDARIHQFSAPPAGYAGLVFESPVFVNGNIHLPAGAATPGASSGRYAAVTFADKVYQGNGIVFRGGQSFSPSTAGRTDDQLWTDIKEFGGFQRGLELDGQRDIGLDILAGIQPGTNVNVTTGSIQLCLDLLRSRSDLSVTANSQLGARLTNAAASLDTGVTYRLGFNDANSFRPQNNTNLGITSSNTRGWRISDVRFSPPPAYQGAVTQTTITLGTDSNAPTISGNLTYNSAISFRYQPTPSPRIPDLEREIRDLDRLIARGADPNGGYPTQADIDAAIAARNTKQAELTQLRTIADQVATITVRANPVFTSDIQPVFLDLVISVTPQTSLTDGDGRPMPFSVALNAFDISCDRGRCRDDYFSGRPRDGRAVGPDYKRNGALNFMGGLPQGLTDDRRNIPPFRSSIANEAVDYAGLQNQCTFGGRSSFGGIDWGYSFAATTRFSWSFTDQSGMTLGGSREIILNNLNSSPPNADFQVHSIANLCTIQATARVVAGFFTCDMLRIEPRTTPLSIIGSFIVGGMEIDPSAYQAGIRWKSIYHPMAANELRSVNILRPLPGRTCAPDINTPVWHPYPSLLESANRENCNVGKLRGRADPFTWTSVDPDCGLPTPASARTVCKHQITRYQVFELFRETSL